ncbi:MAG: RHS repeat-associated core domain-containing protein [Bryobacterales bacterium]
MARYDFTPFGERIPSGVGGRPGAYDGDGWFRQQFTGQFRDDESKLDYFNSRYLAAAIGRFMSPDPAFVDQHVNDPQSWNLYAYVRGNPLVFVDPSGFSCQPLDSNNPQASGYYDDGDGEGCVKAGVKPDSEGGLRESGQKFDFEYEPPTFFATLFAPPVSKYVPDDRPLQPERARTLRNAGAAGAIFPCQATFSAVVTSKKGARGVRFGTRTGLDGAFAPPPFAQKTIPTPIGPVRVAGQIRGTTNLATRGALSGTGVAVKDFGPFAAGATGGVSTSGKLGVGARGEIGSPVKTGFGLAVEARLEFPLTTPCTP